VNKNVGVKQGYLLFFYDRFTDALLFGWEEILRNHVSGVGRELFFLAAFGVKDKPIITIIN